MIPEEIINRIRDSANIAAIIGETVKLTKRGRSLQGLCPFHKEKTPSFHVNPERKRYFCFGCKEKGSAIDFVMKVEGLDFMGALKVLAEKAGIEIPDDGRREHAPRADHSDLYEASAIAAAYFEEQLKGAGARVARDELARRGLGDVPEYDTLHAFCVGYAPDGWDGLAKHFERNGVSPVAGEKTGLLVPRPSQSGHYDRFRNRLMFAIHDLQGRVIAFSGRILPDPETGIVDKETGKYVNSPESAIFRKGDVVFGLFQARNAIRQAGYAILVEGNFDTVSLHARGITNVVAPLGTAFTQPQAKLIKRFAEKITVMFDGDSAGLEATKKSRDPLGEVGLQPSVARLPTGADPDSFIQEKGADALRGLLEKPQGMMEFLIDTELGVDFHAVDAQVRVARVKEVAELIRTEKDDALKAMASQYADAAVLNLSIKDNNLNVQTFKALQDMVAKRGKVSRQGKGPPEPKPPQDRTLMVSLRILGCLMDHPDLIDDEYVEDALSHLEGDVAIAASHVRKIKLGQPEAFIEALPEKLKPFGERRLTCPRHEHAHDAKTEILRASHTLHVDHLKQENEDLKRELAEAQAAGDVTRENEVRHQMIVNAKLMRVAPCDTP